MAARHYSFQVSARIVSSAVRRKNFDGVCLVSTSVQRNNILSHAVWNKCRRASSSLTSCRGSTGEVISSFSPEDGKSAFASSSTLNLLLTCSLLELCRVRPLVVTGASILSWAARQSPGVISNLLFQCARPAFVHFCAGEHLQDCVAVAKRLECGARVRCIVDWSVEEREDSDAWDYNCDRKAETLRSASNALGASAAFMPVKLTALLSPALLERMTIKIVSGSQHAALLRNPRDYLDAGDLAGFESALDRLCKLCCVARDCKVPLLLDAEQTHRQPAVHVFASHLQEKFNTNGDVVVYDTLQMYLRSSSAHLESSLEAARLKDYTYAVKLVRGAYIEQEKATGVIHPSKEATDAAYDDAAARLLSIIGGDLSVELGSDDVCGLPHVAVMLATHNRQSLEKATSRMSELGLVRNHQSVHFAQILGMVDNLTNALGVAGYNAAKLVVFGEIREVLPWLLRRVQENRDAFGAQALELPVLRKELRRRLLRM